MKCVVIGSVHQGIYNDFRSAAFAVSPLVSNHDREIMRDLVDHNWKFARPGNRHILSNEIQFLMLEEK